MIKTSPATRVAAGATALLVATGAFADTTITPELGWGQVSGGRVSHAGDMRRNEPALDAALGVRWDNGAGVRTLWFGALDPWKDFLTQSSPPTFREFWGVQATGTAPLAAKLNFTGGVGLGRASFDRGQPGDHAETTEGVVSAGLQYQPFAHFAMELHADYLTRTHERNLVLMAQVPF